VGFKKKLKKAYDRAAMDRRETTKQALLLGFEGDHETALELLDEIIYLFDSVIDKPSTQAEFWHFKAIALNQLDRNEDALKAIEKAEKILKYSIKDNLTELVLQSDRKEYDDSSLNITHSDILHDLGKYEEALKVISNSEPDNFLANFLRKHIKEKPLDLEIASIQAHLLSHLEKNEEAIELLDYVIKDDPDDIEVLYEKSQALQELEKYDESLKVCEKGLEIAPDDGDLLGQIGLVLLDLGKPKEALSYFEQAIQSDSTDDVSWYNKACALSILNKKEEALDALTVATALDSENIIQMKDEKDLDNIRDSERFTRLSNLEI